MDFNLNDFSGIQNDDSQFMDQSNVNINNVWQQNSSSPIKRKGEDKVLNPQKLIGLQDLNLGNNNLLDMSEIQNQENINEITQKEADILQSLQNNHNEITQQDFGGIMTQMGTIEAETPKLIPTQSAPVVLDSQPAEKETKNDTQNTEWKKPVIQKKRRGGKKPPKAEIPKAQEPPVEQNQNLDVFNNDLNIDDIMIDLPLTGMGSKAPSAPIPTKDNFESRQQNNKYARDSPEPQPLFDCLFCVGIHEHLVLQTVKEKNLKYLYGEKKPSSNVEIEEEEDYKEIERAFSINQLMYDKYNRINVQSKRTSTISDKYEIPSIYASKRQMRGFLDQNQKYNPMAKTISKFVSRVAEIPLVQLDQNQNQIDGNYQVTAAQQYANIDQNAVGETSSMCNEELMVSNMLENFEDIDPEEQSMFMNLNIRNRRQKILHQVSFESEMYDIYAPVFTSDEESITSNSESSGTTSSEGSQRVATEESGKTNSQGSSYESNSSSQSDSQGSPEYDSSSDISNQILNDQITPNKGNTLNERDLDYNSENNNSSLSSIHREIQEAPAEESSNQVVMENGQLLMPDQGHIIRNMGGKLTLAESGGCQVEEMQDDTVMKQCKSMFKHGNVTLAAALQSTDAVIPNESFRDHIFQQRQNQIANQLESLDQKSLIQLELMNLESSPSKADLQSELPGSIARSSQKRLKFMQSSAKTQNIVLSASGKRSSDVINSFRESTQQKKTTGRFNTKAILNSEKSENQQRSSAAKKLQNVLKTGDNSIGETKKFNEDDSIIKILPGFSSSQLKNASGQIDDSQLNPMSSDQLAGQQAVGMTTAFGAESLIQPINYLPEETNQFLMEEIQEVNQSATSQQTPQSRKQEIDFYNKHMRSSKNNQLQIVDSDSELQSPKTDEEDKIQSLSPIAKKNDQTDTYLQEHQQALTTLPSGQKPKRYSNNRINLAKIDTKGQTQKLTFNTQNSPQKINMRTQKVMGRKTTGNNASIKNAPQQYGQMGKNQVQMRRSSNASINSNKKKVSPSQFYQEVGISASTGALPGYEEMAAVVDNQTIETNNSQYEVGNQINKRSKSKRNQGSGVKQTKDLTPIKQKTTTQKQNQQASKTTKKSITKKPSKIEQVPDAQPERINQKTITQKIKQSKININNLQRKEASNKAGNYRVLSKEQTKLMLQLQKQADDMVPLGGKQGQKPKQAIDQVAGASATATNLQTKNIIRDNYFKLSEHEEAERIIPESKTVMKNKPQQPSLYSQNEKGLHQKRSSTNLKNRSRDLSSEMKQTQKKKGGNDVDQNKYRSSMVEPAIYTQDIIKHQVTQSQSVQKGNEMLILEKRLPSDTQNSNNKMMMVIPQLNLETVNSNNLEINQDQFLQTMNIKNQKSSLNKFVKVQNINQQSTKNLNLKAMQKPIGDTQATNNKFLRQMKYQQNQQNLKVQSLTQPGTVPDTDRAKEGVSHETHKSYMHSSTSQLQNFSISQIPAEDKKINANSKIENQSLFAGSDQFIIPAQSHRNPERNAKQKLSISAGKNQIGGKNQNINFMKSTANLKKDFSEIQNSNVNEEGLSQAKHGQASKLSIEQDIKFLKMSLNPKSKQPIEKQSKQIMNTVGQAKRSIGPITKEMQTVISDAGVGSQASNSMRKSRASSIEMKEKKLKGANQRMLAKNKSPTKTPSLQIQTKHIKPKIDMNSGTVSTKSNKMVMRKIKQERVETEASDQKEVQQNAAPTNKQQNFKKLILENNAKILQFQKSQNQTPKQPGGNIQFTLNPSKKQQYINQISNQFQTTSQGAPQMIEKASLESNFSSMPQVIHQQQEKSSAQQRYKKIHPNMQYFKTNEYDDINTLEPYDDGSGISSGEQQIGQLTRDKLNNAQFNSSVNNKSNSLFSGSGYPTNQQKASGSGILGHASIGGLGTTGLTFGAANTTANTNSYIGANLTNNKSGIQKSMLNNLAETANDQQQSTQKQNRKKVGSNQRLIKKSSMKASQDNLDF